MYARAVNSPQRRPAAAREGARRREAQDALGGGVRAPSRPPSDVTGSYGMRANQSIESAAPASSSAAPAAVNATVSSRSRRSTPTCEPISS